MLPEISATHSKIRFFWRKNCKNWHFRLFILGGKGVRLVRIFFWGDPHWLGVKLHGIPKRRPGPPQPTGSRFWPPRIEKRHFSQVFHENLSFLVYFHRSAGRLHDTRNFFQQQVGQNIPIWEVQSKISNIWPPKSSIPKPSSTSHFQSFKLWKWLVELGFDIEDLGVKCCRFLIAPLI